MNLGLCSMCGPRGVSESKLCPSCGSCRHICKGANGNPCQHADTYRDRTMAPQVDPNRPQPGARDWARMERAEWAGEDL